MKKKQKIKNKNKNKKRSMKETFFNNRLNLNSNLS